MQAKLKILLLVTLSEWGGAQHVVFLIAQHLRSDYDVTVACAPGGALIERLREEGVRAVEVPELARNLNPWRDLRAFYKLYSWMRRERFDLVHTHSTKAGLLGRVAARLAAVPVVLFTAHGWAFAEGRAYWKRRLLAHAERLAARVTAKIICVSEHDRELALRWRVAKPGQLLVVHNGIDPHSFLAADGSPVREELRLGKDPVVTFVGRLAPPKDPLTLLEAIRILPEGRVLLIGDGELRPQIERFVQERSLPGRVVMAGFRSDIPEVLAASDVFVLSSRWEGLPLTVIEAMMAGLPVVAARVGGIPELVEDGETGFLVPPSDPEALAEALQRLLEDEGLRRRMGEAGREKALRGFTLERMLAQIQRVYEELLQS